MAWCSDSAARYRRTARLGSTGLCQMRHADRPLRERQSEWAELRGSCCSSMRSCDDRAGPDWPHKELRISTTHSGLEYRVAVRAHDEGRNGGGNSDVARVVDGLMDMLRLVPALFQFQTCSTMQRVRPSSHNGDDVHHR